MAVALHFLQNASRRAFRRERVFRDRLNVMDCYNDEHIISRYRLDRESIFGLVDVLTPTLERPTLRNYAIPPLLQILIALRFYAKGGFLSEIADIHGVSRSSVSRIITNVTEAIVLNFIHAIQFPKDAVEFRDTKQGFYQIAGMPNVVGVVDGTLIPIIRPTEDEPVYVCRKNYHALNVQGVCDARMKYV